jgi:hypothetical protein
MICALRARQRQSGIVPYLLVSPGMLATQRLTAPNAAEDEIECLSRFFKVQL